MGRTVNHNEENKKIHRAVNLVIENGGIDYAFEQMNRLAKEALDLLTPIPDSEAKSALIELVHYTVNRSK